MRGIRWDVCLELLSSISQSIGFMIAILAGGSRRLLEPLRAPPPLGAISLLGSPDTSDQLELMR